MFTDKLDAKVLNESFAKARPFPHVVIDNFLDPELVKVIASELQVSDTSDWLADDHDSQIRKRAMNDLLRLPPTTAQVLRDFNSDETCAVLSDLTGIPDLLADDHYVGGGVHITSSGGTLDIHADFNLHPETGMHRRVNALLFLNDGWEPDWNGQLELWDTDLVDPVQVIEPIMNRLVVFRIRDDAFHGVRSPLACPHDVRRYSLVLYYYTHERPEHEKAPFHWASWQQRHA